MNELEFAANYLGEYRIKKDEINPKYCPICGGGRRHDKYTFFLNPERHAFMCHRGSCGAHGTFAELTKIYNERADYIMEYKKNKFEMMNSKAKNYKKPEIKLTDLSKQAQEYIYKRKISETTCKHFKLSSDKQGNIIFPYYNEKGEHELNKIRIPRKFIKGKDKTKIWQEGGGRPILFGMDQIDVNEPVLIVEGEWEALTAYECGFENVISIPFGTENFEWVNECWEWLNTIKEFKLCYDNDRAGKKGQQEASRKLGVYRCKSIAYDSEGKDLNEIMFRQGENKVLEMINKAEFIPVENLKRLADVEKKEVERILFGNKFLDYYFGGCRMGEATIWTGKRGGGKSTILNQTLIDTVDQKTKCFIYSGELNNEKVKEWLELQIAGEKYITTKKDELTYREEYVVNDKVSKVLSKWYGDYIYTYGDDGKNEEDCLFEIMEYAYKRHNVKRFVLDNLKTIRFKSEKDFYRAQGLFVGRLKGFCRKYNVHIDLVVHPRKTGKDEIDDEDVGGSVDIIDLADNIVDVSKITDKMIERCPDEDEELKIKLQENNTILAIKKNRWYGDTNIKSYYKFNKKSKRIYDIHESDKLYGWEQEVDSTLAVQKANARAEKQEFVSNVDILNTDVPF